MIVRVVEIFPCVVFCVDMVFVEVPMHVDMGKDIRKNRIVMVWNWGERVEEIGIYLSCRWDGSPFLFSVIDLLLSKVWLNNKDVKSNCTWVDKEMSGISHSSKNTKRIWPVRTHFLFNKL